MNRRVGVILSCAPRARRGAARPKFLLSPDLRSRRRRRRAFTLTELLVVMGVIGTLAVLTLVATRKISQDARLALGTNTVIAALNEARALAIKEHKDVVVAFMARLDGPRNQVVEVILAQWTGDTYLNTNGPNPEDDPIDRFLPVPGVPLRTLPKGISVASPFYHSTSTANDANWEPLTYLPWVDFDTGQGELIGQPPGVMFAADGSRILRNSHSDSARSWIDFNNDGLVRRDQQDYLPEDVPLNWAREFDQIYEDDETFVSLAPFVAVYDFDEALERKTLDWSDRDNLELELVGPPGYITELGNRIHFNRYSGVVMR
ncbi:MAG: prepilin-type N-terminal cleavage/methylation domain-containing protein [Planctomycetota bacterium]